MEAIATRAYGVVTRREALAAGVSPDQLRHRLQGGSLLRVHRGVYRVGHLAPSIEADYLAAVKACGTGALLRCLAAGYLFRLLRGKPPAPEVWSAGERKVPGVRVRRARRGPVEATIYRGIAVTTLPRTLVDLASCLSSDALASACHEAGALHGTTPRQVEAVLASHPGAAGAGRLRAVLRGEAKVALSPLERRFLSLLEAEGLPLPETNRPASGRRVDCRWPELRLTVELDSYTYHASRHAWEQDRRRDREARARGDEIRRYSWADVFESPERTMAELRPLLQRRRPG